MDLKYVSYDSANWIYVSHDRNKWWTLVNTVMNTSFSER